MDMDMKSDEIYITLYAAALTGCLTTNSRLGNPSSSPDEATFKLLAKRADDIASAAYERVTGRTLTKQS